MDDETRKLLTEEYLGECWHELDQNVLEERDIDWCLKCHTHIGCLGVGWQWFYPEDKSIEIRRAIHRTFDTPDDMVALKDRLVEKGEWGRFYKWVSWNYEHGKGSEAGHWVSWLMEPTRFCELVGEWLKGKSA
jgi:hypothetical protein